MKKLLSKSYGIIILICIIESFFICLYFAIVVVDAPNYQIIRWGEKTYFSFKDRSYLNDFNWYLEKHQQENKWFYFDSLEDAYQKLRHGTFTEEEYKKIQLRTQDPYGRIELFNIDNLVEPVLPASYTCSQKVLWYDDCQYYTITGDGALSSADFYIIPKSEYRKHCKEWGNYAKYAEEHYVDSVEQIQDKNATVYYCRRKNNNLSQKFITYYIKTGDKTILVIEGYWRENDDIPESVELYGSQGGYCFHVFSYSTREPISTEWISQFGVQKWEG